jgi:hypothetical protein
MGNGDRLVLDFGDCSFEKFVANFRKSMDMMQAYCEQLAPIPRWCEKRFRTSFCKKGKRLSYFINGIPFSA